VPESGGRKKIDVLVVGGGGSGSVGGTATSGAGGGGGGVVFETNYSLNESQIPVSVGSGGIYDGQPKNGQNSSFGILEAQGGGRGGTASSDPGIGGSGGGGVGGGDDISASREGGEGVQGQGNKGGNGSVNGGSGGGGGAGERGGSGNSTHAGAGGDGECFKQRFTEAYGESGCFAGGGAGSVEGDNSAQGGLGGGMSSKSNRIENSGGGGSGLKNNLQYTAKADGTSGTVLLRYKTPEIRSEWNYSSEEGDLNVVELGSERLYLGASNSDILQLYLNGSKQGEASTPTQISRISALATRGNTLRVGAPASINDQVAVGQLNLRQENRSMFGSSFSAISLPGSKNITQIEMINSVYYYGLTDAGAVFEINSNIGTPNTTTDISTNIEDISVSPDGNLLYSYSTGNLSKYYRNFFFPSGKAKTEWINADFNTIEIAIRNTSFSTPDEKNYDVSAVLESDADYDDQAEKLEHINLNQSKQFYTVNVPESSRFRMRIDVDRNTSNLEQTPDISQLSFIAGNSTGRDGRFSFKPEAPNSIGNKSIRVYLPDYRKSGKTFFGVYNASPSFENSSNRTVFKPGVGESSNISVNFTISTPSSNPDKLDLNFQYGTPSTFTLENQTLSESISNGSELYNSFTVNTSKSSAVGKSEISVNASTPSGIYISQKNLTVNVKTVSNLSFVRDDTPSRLDVEEGLFNLTVESIDRANGSRIPDTPSVFSGPIFDFDFSTDNESGLANIVKDTPNLKVGTSNFSVKTDNEEAQFLKGTGSADEISIRVYNLTLSTQNFPKEVVKGKDYNVSALLSAAADNPNKMQASWNYNFPSNTTLEQNNSTSTVLLGTTENNTFAVNLGINTPVGPQNTSINASNDVIAFEAERNQIDVYTKTDVNLTSPSAQKLDISQGEFDIEAKTFDSINYTLLSGVNTSLNLTGPDNLRRNLYKLLETSSTPKFRFNTTKLGLGNYSANITTVDQEAEYRRSNSDIDTLSFGIYDANITAESTPSQVFKNNTVEAKVNLKAASENPDPLNFTFEYISPDGINITNRPSSVSLDPGQSFAGASFNITMNPDATPGSKTIQLKAENPSIPVSTIQFNLDAKTSVTANYTRKPEPKLGASSGLKTAEVETFDAINKSPLGQIQVNFTIFNSSGNVVKEASKTSNENGISEYQFNASTLDVGSYKLQTSTRDKPEELIFSDNKPKNTSFSVLDATIELNAPQEINRSVNSFEANVSMLPAQGNPVELNASKWSYFTPNGIDISKSDDPDFPSQGQLIYNNLTLSISNNTDAGEYSLGADVNISSDVSVDQSSESISVYKNSEAEFKESKIRNKIHVDRESVSLEANATDLQENLLSNTPLKFEIGKVSETVNTSESGLADIQVDPSNLSIGSIASDVTALDEEVEFIRSTGSVDSTTLNVLNATLNIERYPSQVNRAESSNYLVNISLSSDPENSEDLNIQKWDLNLPQGWNINSSVNSTSVAPGEKVYYNASLEVEGEQPEIGQKQISADVRLEGGISGYESLKQTRDVLVYSEIEPSINKEPRKIVDSQGSDVLIGSETVDSVNGSSIQDINTTFEVILGNGTLVKQQTISKHQGSPEFSFSPEGIPPGNHTINVSTQDLESQYYFSSGKVVSTDFQVFDANLSFNVPDVINRTETDGYRFNATLRPDDNNPSALGIKEWNIILPPGLELNKIEQKDEELPSGSSGVAEYDFKVDVGNDTELGSKQPVATVDLEGKVLESNQRNKTQAQVDVFTIAKTEQITAPQEVDAGRDSNKTIKASVEYSGNGTPLTGAEINFSLIGDNGAAEFSDNKITDDEGLASKDFVQGNLEPGNYTVKASILNTPEFVFEGGGLLDKTLEAYGANLSVKTADKKASRPDTYEQQEGINSNAEIQLQLTASSKNPRELKNIDIEYNVSEGWEGPGEKTLQNLSPGETRLINYTLNTTEDLGLGPQELSFNTSGTTLNTIDQPNSLPLKVAIWTQAELNKTYIVRDGDKISTVEGRPDSELAYAKTTDISSGSPISNAKVAFQVVGQDNLNAETKSNDSGVATSNIDFSVLESTVQDDSNYQLGARTIDNPSAYINATSGVRAYTFDKAGFMEKNFFDKNATEAYRVPENSGNGVIELNASFVDAFSEKVPQNTDVEFELPGGYTKNVDINESSPYAVLNYNPNSSVSPGNYTINITGTAPGYSEEEVQTKANVRGILNPVNLVDSNEEIIEGRKLDLFSIIKDKTGERVDADQNWYIGGQKISGADSNTTLEFPASETDGGNNQLKLSVSKRYFDNANQTKPVEIYEVANVTDIKPDDNIVSPGANILLSGKIIDANTGNPISSIPANLSIDGETEETSVVNGVINYSWIPERGNHESTLTIQRNNTEYFVTGRSSTSQTYNATDTTFIESVSVSENSLFRSFFGSPRETDITVKVRQTSPEGGIKNSNGTLINFTSQAIPEGTNTETDENGIAELTYNPGSDAELGTNEFVVKTEKQGFNDDSRSLSLRIQLEIAEVNLDYSSIDNPKPIRGEELNLTLSGKAESQGLPLNPKAQIEWSLKDKIIASKSNGSKKASATIPGNTPVGESNISVEFGGEAHPKTVSRKNIDIFGQSNIKLISPSNDTSIGVTETQPIKCKVKNEKGDPLTDYPVTFSQDGAPLETVNTSSNGKAEYSWDVPNSLQDYNIGCSIDNQTDEFYIADLNSSEDSRIYTTTDREDPDIDISSTPGGIIAGEQSAILEFDVEDEIGVSTVKALVRRPLDDNNISLSDTGVELTESEDQFKLNISPQRTQRVGTYQSYIVVNDTSGNTQTEQVNFPAVEKGQTALSPNSYSSNSITQRSGDSFKFNISQNVSERSEYLNFTAPEISFGSVKPKKRSCGTVEKDGNCEKQFNVSIDPGVSESTKFITMQSEWIGNKTGPSASSTALSVNVQPNPLVETSSRWDTPLAEDGKLKLESPFVIGSSFSKLINISSIGNVKADDLSLSLSNSSISKSLFTLQTRSIESIQPGKTRQVVMNFDVPRSISKGEKRLNVTVNSSNADTTEEESIIEVKSINAYNISQEQKQALTIKENPGQVDTTYEIFNTGNEPNEIQVSSIETVDKPSKNAPDPNISIAPSTITLSPKQSKEVKFITENVSKNGSYKIRIKHEDQEGTVQDIDISLDARSFLIKPLGDTSTEKVTTIERATIENKVEVAGKERTNNLNFNIRLRNDTTGENLKAENIVTLQNQGVFTHSFGVPEVTPGFKYDLVVEVLDLENDIQVDKVVENRISIPDIREPSINKIRIDDPSTGTKAKVEINATDDSLSGVENVKVNVLNTNVSKNLTRNTNGIYSGELESINQTGEYILEVKASDSAGNLAGNQTPFYVSEPEETTGIFQNTKAEQDSAKIKLKHPESGRTISQHSLTSDYEFEALSQTYDLKLTTDNNSVTLRDVTYEGQKDPIDASDLSANIAPVPPNSSATFVGMAVETKFNPSSGKVNLQYGDEIEQVPQGRTLDEMKLARCIDYKYFEQTCQEWGQDIENSKLNIDRPDTTVTAEVPGFSAYVLYFPDQNPQDNSQPSDSNGSTGGSGSGGSGSGGGGSGGGGSGGGGSVSEENVEQPTQTNITGGIDIGVDDITVSLQPGEEFETSLVIQNRFEEDLIFDINPTSSIEQFLQSPSTLNIQSGESEAVDLDISVDSQEQPGSYSGSLTVASSESRDNIPVNIDILPSSAESLNAEIEVLADEVQPNESLRIKTDISNQLYQDRVDVEADYQFYKPENTTVMKEITKTISASESTSEVVEMKTPKNLEDGRYEIRLNASYSNIGTTSSASDIDSFRIKTSIWEKTIFGFTLLQIGLASVIASITSIIAYKGYRYRKRILEAKKRYNEDIDMDTIPGGGARRAYLGKLAEVGKVTYLKIDDLVTHGLIAGATGSGKTVTGQAIVEEALEEGANVIVLDPTAQWSGYLNQCEEGSMLDLYPNFDMESSDTRSYKGNIRAIEPDQTDIDISDYLETEDDQNEGEIIVFSMHNLDSENVDKFVDSTIQQVFDENLSEKDHLESLIVYDEAHRLLEKFGGSGTGVTQLERGAREFRKYGVGMLLLSQVVSDFPEEFRANVGTTIQMRTQDEGDLERISNKFGKEVVQSIARAEIGSGMIQNSEYNHGKPYFINFRPLKHSPHRLSDENLEKYEKYNRQIDQMEEKIKDLDSEGDIYEYKSKIKLAKKNLRSGSFNLVDIYLDELEDSI
jgi:uncharacterized membrane protein YgcG